MFVAHWKQLARLVILACDRESGDFAFDERQFESADPGRLARAVDVCDTRLLKLIDAHASVFNYASKQLRELDVRHEMIATREIIARDLPTARQHDAF